MEKHPHLFLSFSKTARNFPNIFQADTLEFHAYAEVEMPWSGKGCHPGRLKMDTDISAHSLKKDCPAIGESQGIKVSGNWLTWRVTAPPPSTNHQPPCRKSSVTTLQRAKTSSLSSRTSQKPQRRHVKPSRRCLTGNQKRRWQKTEHHGWFMKDRWLHILPCIIWLIPILTTRGASRLPQEGGGVRQ